MFNIIQAYTGEPDKSFLPAKEAGEVLAAGMTALARQECYNVVQTQ